MKITRTSPFSGETNTLDIPVTQDQLDNWNDRMLIQDAMPNISPEHREFIKTGITELEWNNLFSFE